MTSTIGSLLTAFSLSPKITYFKSFSEQQHPSRIVACTHNQKYTHVASGAALCSHLLRHLYPDPCSTPAVFPGVGEMCVLKMGSRRRVFQTTEACN